MSGTFQGKEIEIAVKVLDAFNEANNQKRVHQKIDFKEFYNDAINKEVNLKQHYEVWVIERDKAKKHHRAFDKARTFTLCAYPWILDSANKADLLKVDNKYNQM